MSNYYKLTFTLSGLAALLLATISIGLPDNEIRAVAFEPTGKTTLQTNISIKFSKDMVSKDSLDMPRLDPPVVFTPAIQGIARWIETDVLRFFPDSELGRATEYKATIASNKTWASGCGVGEI